MGLQTAGTDEGAQNLMWGFLLELLFGANSQKLWPSMCLAGLRFFLGQERSLPLAFLASWKHSQGWDL